MTSLTDVNTQIMISVYLKRDTHDNGMTLAEYANAVIAGTAPTLDHDAFVYQFGTTDDYIKVVSEWAAANNLTIVDAENGTATIKLLGTVGQFNTLFDIQLEDITDNNRIYVTHTKDLTIPNEINDVVEMIAGLDNSVSFKHNAIPNNSAPFKIDPNIISNPTPLDLAQAYQFPRTSGNDQSQGVGACVAIVELGGGWTTQNLTSTFSRIGLSNPNVVDILVDGATNDPTDANSSAEVMLDIYCTGAVIPSGKIAMYFAPNSFQGFIDCITAATNDNVNNPSVISISWGTTDTNWSTQSRQSFDTALQAAIIRGITTFVAIGDFGTQAINGGPTYTVQYPGTSPYVVSSGGTIVTINNDYTIASETVWNQSSYSTGGGISTLYSIPSWQSGKGYTYKLYPAGTVTALTTRGVPDISAMATGYQFYYSSSNTFGNFVGTSAVAPLLAGMMGRINAYSNQRVGFINSTVYANPNVFNDITVGNNAAPNTQAGYSATASWDACTGLGSPVGTAMAALFSAPSTVAPIFPSYTVGTRPSTGQTFPRVNNYY
jgi:kumamolisin